MYDIKERAFGSSGILLAREMPLEVKAEMIFMIIEHMIRTTAMKIRSLIRTLILNLRESKISSQLIVVFIILV